MTDGPTSDLDALRNILEEAHEILTTTILPQGRVSVIREILAARGLSFEKPYVATWQKGNATFFAYPDAVCLAVLEYYAFEADQNRCPFQREFPL